METGVYYSNKDSRSGLSLHSKAGSVDKDILNPKGYRICLCEFCIPFALPHHCPVCE